MQSIFKTLIDGSGAAFALTKVVVGQAVSGSINGILAFVFRDSSGNATTVQLNNEGAVPVTMDAGTTIVGPAAKVTAATLEGAGVGVREPVTSINLLESKNYTKITANVSATRWTLFELVKIEDEGGSPTEELLGFAVLEAGQTNWKIGLDCDAFSTDATANTKKVYLYASHLDNKASDVYGKFSCNEIA